MIKMEKRRVLVVENDLSLCDGLKDILELEAYLPLVSADADAALRVFNDFSPELIILGFGSRPSLGQLRIIDSYQGLYPIIYLCYHYAAKDLLREHWRIRIDSILTKPFDVDDLLRMIFYNFEILERLKTW